MGGLTCPPGHWCPQLHGLSFLPPVVQGASAAQTPGCNSEQWTTPNAPQAAALSKQVGVKKRWALVWCYERCYKEENEKRRHGLRQSLEAIGGTLVCMKKAATFAIRWLEKKNLPAYVLVTAWREAQPCAEHLLRGLKNGTVPSDRQPLGIVVLCVNKEYHRAAAWAKQVSTSLGLALAVDIHRAPPASLGEPLRSLIYDNFANLSAGTQAVAECAPRVRAQPQQQQPQQEQRQQQRQRRQQQQQQQQQQQPQGMGRCLKGLEGGETQPTPDLDNMASEGEEDFLETPTKIEEASYHATYGAEGYADLQGIPLTEAVDWVAGGPDAHLTAMLRRYGMVEGETMLIEQIYADLTTVRL